jgi:hypothetical protein
MANFRFDGVNRHPAPQLPAFCRTRRPITTTVRVSTLQQLQWLIWVLLTLQLSTILLLLSGPVPAPRRPQAGDPLAATDAAAVTVLSPSQR